MKNLLNTLKLAVFTTVLFTSLNSLQAQKKDYKFKHFSVSEGLSQSTVLSIMQDSKGFIWFGTRTGGLNKYDGYTFTVYKNNRKNPCSISGNAILKIFEDSKGYIWIGTRDAGVSRFNTETECFSQYFANSEDENTLYHNTVGDIYEDPSGQIWMATNSGLCRYNPEEDNFIRYVNSSTQNSYRQTQSLCGKGDILVIGTKNNGIFLVNTLTGETIKNLKYDEENNNSISDNNITKVILDSQGRIWAGTRNKGLNKLNDLKSDNFIRYNHNPDNITSLSDNIIRTLHEDAKGNIWIGTKNGVNLLTVEQQKNQDPQFTHYQQDNNNYNSLIQNSIYSFMEDDRGNFWIGTWSGGVDYLNVGDLKFQHYKYQLNSNICLSNNVVSSFAENEDGIWVGTEGGGLNLLDRETNIFKHFVADLENPNSLQSNHIKSLYIDNDGDLWVGTYNGLNLYNKADKTFSHFLKGESIYSIEGDIGDNIWIGSSEKLFKLNKSSNQIKEYVRSSKDTTSISNKTVTIIFKDKNDGIWVGTKIGLNYYNREDDNFTRFLYNKDNINSISNNYISSICQDMSGTIWVGTQDGLNKFNSETKSFELYGEDDGLPDNVINSMLSDAYGNIWVTTNKGLSKFSPSISDEKEVTIRNYDTRDGLQGNEFVLNSAYKSNTGELFFGGTNGFNVFNPDKIKDNKHKPNVVITEFNLFNKKVVVGGDDSPLKKHISLTDKIKLNHKQSVFSFGFVALDYTSPEKNQYAYMMEGFDDKWNYVGNRREASYTNLPAGDYTFKVIASNNDGLWNLEGTSIDISIKPPWWKTTFFYILVFVLIVGLIYTFIKAREQQSKRDKERLENELREGKKEIEQQQAQVKQQQEALKEKEEHEKAAKWHNNGFIQLSNLISEKRHDLKQLASSLIFELVSYIGAQMGAIYFTHTNGNKEQIKLMGGYALDSKRLNESVLEVGEGLVGTCYRKKETVNISNLPNKYAKLDSGLGETQLSNLILIPIIYEDSIQGVIELISFEEIEVYKVKLIEAICKNLGATLMNEKANQSIQSMLEETKMQQETLSAHEEELRMNIEELSATQEESSKREEELLNEIEDLKSIITKQNS